MSVRYEREEEFLASAFKRVGGGLRDVQRATGTEKARTMLAAQEALTSANGKSKVWFSSTPPPGVDHKVGDTWFDASNSNRINEWDGDDWVPVKLGENAIEDLAITNAKIANLDGGKIVAGSIDTLQLNADAIDGMTITGALIRTAPSGQRMEFDTHGLRAFNSSGTETAVLFAATGGMLLDGTLNVAANGGSSSVALRGQDGVVQCSQLISGLQAASTLGSTDISIAAPSGYGGVASSRAISAQLQGGRPVLMLSTSAAGVSRDTSLYQNVAGDTHLTSGGPIDIRALGGVFVDSRIALGDRLRGDNSAMVALSSAGLAYDGLKFWRTDQLCFYICVGGSWFRESTSVSDRPWARIDATTYGPAIGTLGTGVTHVTAAPYSGLQARVKGGVLYISGALGRVGGFPSNHVLFTLGANFLPGAPSVQYAYASGHNFVVATTTGAVIIAIGTASADISLGLTVPLS